MPTGWSQIDSWARIAIPVGLTALTVLLTALPLPLPGVTMFMPSLGLAATFSWAVRRPELLPPVSAFLLGLLQDVVTASPLGASPLLFVLAHAVGTFQHDYMVRRGLLAPWLVYGLLLLIEGAIAWVLTVIDHWQLIDPSPLWGHILVSMAAFPAIFGLFRLVQKLIPSRAI